jgi:hypothetical protein
VKRKPQFTCTSRLRILLASLLFFGVLSPVILGSESQLRTAGVEKANGADSSTSFSKLVLGYVFDPLKGALRPLFGIPGSATLGDPLDLKIKLSRAWISPRQDYALAESPHPDSGGLMLVNLQNDPISIEAVPGIPPGPDLVALSPTGSSAVLYFQESKRVDILRNLPYLNTQLSPNHQLSLTQIPGEIESFAVSDDGSAVLVGCSEGEIGAIYVLTPVGDSRMISIVGRAAAMVFLARSRDVLVADSKANEVVLLRDVTGGAVKTILAGIEEGISEPMAVEASENNKRVFITNSGGNKISVLELGDGSVRHLPSPGGTLNLCRLKGDGVFLLPNFSVSPIWLLDGGETEPRIVFVPYSSPSGPFLGGRPLPDRGSPHRVRVRDIVK